MTSGTEAASLSLPSRDFASLSCRNPLSPVDAKQDGPSVSRWATQAERSVKGLVVDTDDILDKDVGSSTEEERMGTDVHRRQR